MSHPVRDLSHLSGWWVHDPLGLVIAVTVDAAIVASGVAVIAFVHAVPVGAILSMLRESPIEKACKNICNNSYNAPNVV